MKLLTAYRILSAIMLPVLLCWLLLRAARKKEDLSRLSERLGLTSTPRPNGQLVWIHAASVGELNAALPLVMRLSQTVSDLTILITTGTITSAQLARKQCSHQVMHQFAPIDSLPCVRLFLKHWKPDLAIWMESELWPNLVLETHCKHIPMMLLNARISDRSVHRWKRYSALFMSMMRCFHVVMSASASDAKRFKGLGIDWVSVQHNIKYDAPPLNVNRPFLERLNEIIGNRPHWLAASTHEGEEEVVLQAHHMLKRYYPDILTLIVPRHAVRGDAVEKLVASEGMSLLRLSKDTASSSETDIIIGDVMGEMGAFFMACPIVLMGGTLVMQGGHNPIEPAQLGCATMAGPHMFHFADMAAEWIQHGAIQTVANPDDIVRKVNEWLEHEDVRKKWAIAAMERVQTHKGVLETLCQQIIAQLQKPQQEAVR